MSDQAYGKYIQDKCGTFLCSQATTDHTLREVHGLWVCPVCGASYGAGRKETLKQKLVSELDGQDYDGGKLEDIEATVDKLHRFCATLGQALVDKGVFTEDEILDMVHGG